MSDLLTTTLHSAGTEPAQDPQTEITLPTWLGHHAARVPTGARLDRLLRHFEENLAEEVAAAKADKEGKTNSELLDDLFVEAVRIKARRLLPTIPDPQGSSNPWPGAEGFMDKGLDGRPKQSRKKTKSCVWNSMEDRSRWLDANAQVGEKHLGPYDFDAFFVFDRFAKKWNCLACYQLTLDIDVKEIKDKDGNIIDRVQLLKTEEDEARWDAWAISKGGVIIQTTSSHDPEGSGKRCRKYRWMIPATSYKDKDKIGKMIRRDAATENGVDLDSAEFACLDPIIERGVQLQYSVRCPTPERWAQRTHRMVPGPAFDLEPYYQRVFEDEAREEARLLAVEETKKVRAERAKVVGQDTLVIADTSTESKVAAAQRMLSAHGPATRAGDPNHTIRAIGKLKGLGLSVEEAWPLLETWNAQCSPPWDSRALRSKLVRGYATSKIEAGSFLPKRAQGGHVGELLAQLDLPEPAQEIYGSEPAYANPYTKGRSESSSHGVSAQVLAVLDPWRSRGVTPPAKLTQLHTPALPPLRFEELHKLTCISSPWGTQKTRALIPLVKQVLEMLFGRIVMMVPNQNLSLSTARMFGIQSHLDPSPDWTGSIVTTYHSLHKVKLSSFVKATGEFGLGDEEVEVHHPVTLFVGDEAMELNDVRVGDLVRQANTCDLNHHRCIEIIESGAKTIALNAFMDTDTIRWQQHLQGWTSMTEGADWELVTNDHLAVAPVLYTGANPKRLRKRIHEAVLAGDPVLVPCSTVPTCEDEARQLAISVMSVRAGFEVKPFLGKGGVKALHPVDQLPELQNELAKHGKTIEEVRPRILVIDRNRMTEEAQELLANPELIWNYDALFHTASISSGFSITRPMRGFAFFEAGAGPVADGLLQMVFRLRNPIGNKIEVCLTGSAPLRSQDKDWWYDKQTRLGSHTDAMIKGLCSYHQTRKGGATWITDYNEHLMWSLAESNARRESQTHICDTYDDMGRVIERGAFSAMAMARGLQVVSMRELEVQEELGLTVEQVKSDKADKKERREAIREEDDEVPVKVEKISKEEADRLKKSNDRRPETRAKIRSAYIRHHYGLEDLTTEDVAWDRKWYRATNLFAGVQLMAKDRDKAIKRMMEGVGPVTVHHRHRALLADLMLRWSKVVAPGGLESAAANQTELQALGAYLAADKAERQLFEDVTGLRTSWDVDLEGMDLTNKFLKMLGLGTKRKSKRLATGKKSWSYLLRLESWNTMVQKSKAALLRLEDPEKAAQQWALVEAAPAIRQQLELVAAILAA